MTSPNFTSILDESPSEVAAPMPLPIGTYLCRVLGQPRYDKSAKKGTEYTEFTLKFIEATDDVDAVDLEESLSGTPLTERTTRITFYHTPDSIYRLDQFHQHCGLDLEDGLTRRQRNEEIATAEVLVVLGHDNSNDGQQIYARVRRTLAS